ncbi:MAG: SDR family oxidoreductase [Candidatus Cyclobacteriaceae bacterium M3_2C_046]
MKDKPDTFPQQHQSSQPGEQHEMHPEPEIIRDSYKGTNKLQDKVALITGGDSGIGRSVAIHYAREGADIVITYQAKEKEDAAETRQLVEKEGRQCITLEGDVKDEDFCRDAVNTTVNSFGKIDILVNNAAVQFPADEFEQISSQQFKKTFETNIYPFYYFSNEAIKYIPEGGTIINTTSVTAYRGSAHLIDYSSTKGAILTFTRSLAKNLAEKGIRVNAVAPGPIWTPLIPSSFDQVEHFGQKAAFGRAGQPSEVGPAYVFLASLDGSYITGQVIHINGGEFIGA